jgi:hypothetical protein
MPLCGECGTHYRNFSEIEKQLMNLFNFVYGYGDDLEAEWHDLCYKCDDSDECIRDELIERVKQKQARQLETLLTVY